MAVAAAVAAVVVVVVARMAPATATSMWVGSLDMDVDGLTRQGRVLLYRCPVPYLAVFASLLGYGWCPWIC